MRWTDRRMISAAVKWSSTEHKTISVQGQRPVGLKYLASLRGVHWDVMAKDPPHKQYFCIASWPPTYCVSCSCALQFYENKRPNMPWTITRNRTECYATLNSSVGNPRVGTNWQKDQPLQWDAWGLWTCNRRTLKRVVSLLLLLCICCLTFGVFAFVASVAFGASTLFLLFFVFLVDVKSALAVLPPAAALVKFFLFLSLWLYLLHLLLLFFFFRCFCCLCCFRSFAVLLHIFSFCFCF